MSEFLMLGSFSPILKKLRREKEIYGWREASLYHGHYACIISGLTYDLTVHHLKSFSSILEETVDELTQSKIIDSDWYLAPCITNEIRSLFLKKHRVYGLGVVLHKKIHREFHRLYGNKNTHEQFKDFKNSITRNRLDELLKTPEDGDTICTKCNKVVEILFNDSCLNCLDS
ncbi:hypothetical protein [Aquibacillus albus]|uniref:Uncharacterized protein n=1 Tax=Aquibacillus albus TaxID=1168171 RepID=A0ABS2N457_9BACI|nr:hypothetical protein [Aquibacillus albus]MBM7572930.1 hypothetical protein [Aquibacillus albus]